jgi:hypothetical protein
MPNSVSAVIPDVPALSAGEPKAPPPPVPLRPNSVVSLAPFLTLVRELAAEIIPLHLRAEFRDELQCDLMAAARQQYAHDLLMWSAPASPRAKTSRRWMLGAATLGLGSAVSLASIATAYYWRHRRRQAA